MQKAAFGSGLSVRHTLNENELTAKHAKGAKVAMNLICVLCPLYTLCPDVQVRLPQRSIKEIDRLGNRLGSKRSEVIRKALPDVIKVKKGRNPPSLT